MNNTDVMAGEVPAVVIRPQHSVATIKGICGLFAFLALVAVIFGTWLAGPALFNWLKTLVGVHSAFVRGICYLVPLIVLSWLSVRAIKTVYEELRRSRFAATTSHCYACDYSLAGNMSGTCPECGTPIADYEYE